MDEKLQKRIANLGYCSRRKAEELIKNGKVKVNGKVVDKIGTRVTLEDKINVEGKNLIEKPKLYYLLNKPRKVITSISDNLGRTTVIDLINCKERIYPIGRLDYDTTGILLLTNDGDFANLLMHPKNNIEKTYLAKLNKIFSMADYFNLKKGIIINGKKVNISKIKIRKKDKEKNTSFVEITIHEGRNHIVKNIFKEMGYDVLKLKREKYGFLTLGNLKSGEYRKLKKYEIERFYRK